MDLQTGIVFLNNPIFSMALLCLCDINFSSIVEDIAKQGS